MSPETRRGDWTNICCTSEEITESLLEITNCLLEITENLLEITEFSLQTLFDMSFLPLKSHTVLSNVFYLSFSLSDGPTSPTG